MSATRDLIVGSIDWPCEVKMLYSEMNQGCRVGVNRAISWFFEHVEEGIILEDDCVPHPDFFPYCAELLERYRDDQRIWCISGNNFQDGQWRGDGSYYFGRIPLIWGWASWRRCWQHYDVDLQRWPALRDSGLLETIFEDPLERQFWRDIWEHLCSEGVPDTWDYQWTLTCLRNGGLTSLPNRNLVSNVGFGADATHTTVERDPTAIAEGLGELVHPSFVLRDAAADRYTFDHHFGGASMRRSRELVPRIKARLRFHGRQLLRSQQ
ncbi:glycosyltransferase family 2 protein [Synechococcus sp. Cruz-9H2]|uniref:glycosyltransferase family 2 protein n=1 Tax=unclassified Synechococcus TaxID=2626047 RepID=UPI0020CF5612|nr:MULTISPECIES: glycosyltransferase family 2 protein [unclassified Synechococcus]MCP9820629.1 glycosyltransferase family 2 protein [Synechococcus sp. Cruz-9H2]MCP9844861.1 glycosyltransferase family 2 protein [Synechococcus sp. Edmonson 11F2]MCP9856982.1 glycosyltransferase family 2 protein [Synechococcus sp. Cruz-9C9]MCP9864269.1 glycosyltransferase family 2 protein [Synechococcus sp. Cruz-7E5]MCP9871537.1 glycosyltransferase family 2 protein [Synechococcus sp. Cruz-7B9]